MKRIALILFLTSIVLELQAQSDFQPAYYITNDNDTVFGLIDFKSENRSSKSCLFKKDAQAEAIEFEAKDIKAYRFTNGKYYISKTIKLANEQEEKLLFLEYLLNGIANLYYYNDTKSGRYLIEMQDGLLYELTIEEKEIYSEEMGRVIKKTNKHIGLLKVAFGSCPEIHAEIDKVELNHQSLIDIVKKYHDCVCTDHECIIYKKTIPPVKLKFAPFIGINSYNFVYKSAGFYEQFTSEPNLYPSIGILTDIYFGGIEGKTAVTIGIIYSNSYNYSYYTSESVVMNSSSAYDFHYRTEALEPSVGIKYTHSKKSLRPSIGFGVTGNFQIGSEARLLSELEQFGVVTTSEKFENPISKTFLGGYIQAGCDFKINSKIILFTNLRYSYYYGAEENFDVFGLSLGFYL